MADLPPKLAELLEDFKLIHDNNERMDMLLYYAEDFEEVPASVATRPFDDDHRVPACESQAYVWSELQDDGNLQLYFAVENPQGVSAKALAAILTETVSGSSPSEITKLETDVVYELFGKKMSMGKSAGLTSMINVVKGHAIDVISRN